MNLEAVKKLKEEYLSVYEAYGGNESTFNALFDTIVSRMKNRPKELHRLDLREHDWFMSEKMVGMMLYVDLFADNLIGLIDKIDYLKELGITYVHLMPLLLPRKGENDGGYAVENYKEIDPSLGSLKDFTKVLSAFRYHGIDVCIDYVLNHTADTHEWALKALEGDEKYQDMFIMYDNREIPDIYDRFVPEVLPDKSPGNFTYIEKIDKWVFTSFSSFQWDLNFKNPYVFEQMVDIMLFIANQGVNMIRLDAIAFMWKEPGTTCRNLPQVHDLLHLFHLVKEIACPSVALLGEAIVEPDEIFKYFGKYDNEKEEQRVECGILYNANLMVDLFNSLATRDVRLLESDARRYHIPKTGCFMNYIRCHDDIGWGFNEDTIAYFGLDPYMHKQFLINFYSDRFEGSFSKGEIYQYNPKNHDARTNGTLASLLGLEKASERNDERERQMAHYRIRLIMAMIFSQPGIPLLYSGDEIATLNDQSYKKDMHKSAEGRWVHRAKFDWERAKKRTDLHTNEGLVFQFIKRISMIRKTHPIFNSKAEYTILSLGNTHVYGFLKQLENQTMICLFNFSEDHQYFSADVLRKYTDKTILTDLITDKIVTMNEDAVKMFPYESLWLV
jgi:glycosidase